MLKSLTLLAALGCVAAIVVVMWHRQPQNQTIPTGTKEATAQTSEKSQCGKDCTKSCCELPKVTTPPVTTLVPSPVPPTKVAQEKAMFTTKIEYCTS